MPVEADAKKIEKSSSEAKITLTSLSKGQESFMYLKDKVDKKFEKLQTTSLVAGPATGISSSLRFGGPFNSRKINRSPVKR